MSLRRPSSEAVPVESKQNLTDGDARWKIPECWRDESHESHRKKCQLNSTACPTRSNASVSEGWEQRGSKCPIRLPHPRVDSPDAASAGASAGRSLGRRGRTQTSAPRASLSSRCASRAHAPPPISPPSESAPPPWLRAAPGRRIGSGRRRALEQPLEERWRQKTDLKTGPAECHRL